MRTFEVEMKDPGCYYCSSFILKSIDGAKPMTPRIGDYLSANDLLNMVANGNIVKIFPKT